MSSLFEKLNLKDEAELLIVAAPPSLGAALDALHAAKPVISVEHVETHALLRAAHARAPFALAFVQTQAQVDRVASALAARMQGDVKLWLAYPKKTSKRFMSEINRDSGWQSVGDAGFEPVRQVAIDEDWSALRFRRAEFIKEFKRTTLRAISPTGKRKQPKATS